MASILLFSFLFFSFLTFHFDIRFCSPFPWFTFIPRTDLFSSSHVRTITHSFRVCDSTRNGGKKDPRRMQKGIAKSFRTGKVKNNGLHMAGTWHFCLFLPTCTCTPLQLRSGNSPRKVSHSSNANRANIKPVAVLIKTEFRHLTRWQNVELEFLGQVKKHVRHEKSSAGYFFKRLRETNEQTNKQQNKQLVPIER